MERPHRMGDPLLIRVDRGDPVPRRSAVGRSFSLAYATTMFGRLLSSEDLVRKLHPYGGSIYPYEIREGRFDADLIEWWDAGCGSVLVCENHPDEEIAGDAIVIRARRLTSEILFINHPKIRVELLAMPSSREEWAILRHIVERGMDVAPFFDEKDVFWTLINALARQGKA